MKSTKALFLFLALILPVCIFLFLKFFGRNEYDVKPLFSDSPPPTDTNCTTVTTVPYVVHDSIRSQLVVENDSLVVIAFNSEAADINSTNQMKRIAEEVSGLPVSLLTFSGSERHLSWKSCVFFLKGSQDLVVVDRHGRIRGQYTSTDREDADRLLTEVTIILKRY
jgi:hypothetical protein